MLKAAPSFFKIHQPWRAFPCLNLLEKEKGDIKEGALLTMILDIFYIEVIKMPTLWSDTFSLMLLGMGTVFVFLLLLIVSLYIMSSVIERINPTPDTDTSKRDKDIAVVAAAAYQLHNNRS